MEKLVKKQTLFSTNTINIVATIPQTYAKGLKLGAGDDVSVELDFANDAIVIKKLN